MRSTLAIDITQLVGSLRRETMSLPHIDTYEYDAWTKSELQDTAEIRTFVR